MRTRKMLRAFLKTCRAVQLLHACVIKFKVSGTVASWYYIVLQHFIYCSVVLHMLVMVKCVVKIVMEMATLICSLIVVTHIVYRCVAIILCSCMHSYMHTQVCIVTYIR